MGVVTFGEKLQSFRIKSKLTQKEVASILKISRQSISKWENNQSLPTIDLLVPLTDILNCTLDDLLGIKSKRII